MKKFKTVVINVKKIKLIGMIIVAVCLLCTLFFSAAFAVKKSSVASSEAFREAIVAAQLHNERRAFSPGALLKKITGCDITDAKSIIENQLPSFSEEFAPTPTPEAVETPPPALPTEEAPIREVKSKSDMSISNRTNISVDPNLLADEALCFSLEKTDKPQILIFHTHTTESFSDVTYISGSSDRNLDETKNITAVGEAMAEVFKTCGIETIHDKTVHDYPSFNGAYTRSLATVKANLEKNPQIKIVLDIHRDGIVKDDGTKVKVAADINGEKTAQCMFVIGSNANLTHDNWKENMKFACKIQRLANEMYPGLMRPIILREERFNQQVSTGSLIIEIGSNGNTLSEAVRGGKYMAEVISKLFDR